MTGWYPPGGPELPGDGLPAPESAYEARSRTGCPCGCQGADEDGELNTPAKVRAALLRMTELGVGGVGHEPGGPG
jgi:hypothetical protein